MNKILLSAFCCLFTYHSYFTPTTGIHLSWLKDSEQYIEQQGFSDLNKTISERPNSSFASRKGIQRQGFYAPPPFFLSISNAGFIGLPAFISQSYLLKVATQKIFDYYWLAILFMLLLIIVLGFFMLKQSKARRDAETSEAFFRALVDESPIAMVIYKNLNIEYVNPAMERLSGYRQDELISKEIWQIINPENLTGQNAENWFLMKNGTSQTFEFQLKNRFQREVWVLFSARLIDFFGKPAFLATAIDVTERVKADQQKELPQAPKEEFPYQRLFEENLAPIIIYDAVSNQIKNANPAACLLYGFKHAEIVNLNLADIQIPELQTGHQKNVFTHRLKNGDLRLMHLLSSELKVDEQKLIESIVIDVTDQKRLEAEIMAAREAAEEASKAKSGFISSVSHEIRTPLNSIIGIADLLVQEKGLSKEQMENLHSLKFSSNHLLGIINDVLDFSKLEAGKIKLERSDFNLEQLIKDTVRSFEFGAAAKGIPIQLRFNPNVPKVIKADEGHLRQVLINLLGNAIKFTSEGHIDVYVKMLEQSDAKCRLMFSISDTGIGIPEDKRKTIFERFSQAEDNTFRKFGGTGLGLSISKRLVELQGGAIGVKSIEGIGSTFWFEIPVEISEKRIEAVYAKTRTGEKNLEGLNLLLVEDDKMNQFVMAQFFRKWNANVEIAENGKHAIEILSRKSFDLALIDVHMPELDGFETTSIIRDPNSEVIDHHIPIIALTADINPETRVRVREVGMNDFVSKPSDPDMLYQKIVDLANLRAEITDEVGAERKTIYLTSGNEVKELKIKVKLALREIFDDNIGATISMIDHFMRQIPATLERVANFVEKNDGGHAVEALHTIKPGFHYLGFSDAANQVEELQELIKKARAPGDIQKHMLILERKVLKIMHVLREILQELESAGTENEKQ